MWLLSQPWWHIVLRALIIYVGLYLLFRASGRKQLGEMSPFDFMLLLIVSESVSNGLSGGDNSLTAGLTSAATLMALSFVVDYLAFKSKKFESVVEGEPQFIILKGKICEDVRRKEMITYEELESAMREQKIDDIRQIKYAVLETNGRITVIKESRDFESGKNSDTIKA